MKKILYIASTLKKTGPVNQLRNIIKNLDREQYSPQVITLSPEPAESLWSAYEDANIPVQSLNLSRVAGALFAKSRLEKLVKQIQPDLIHTQGFRPDVLSSKLSIKVPKVCTIRNFPQEDFLMTYGKLVGSYMCKNHVAAMRKMNYTIGVSNAVSDNLKTTFAIKNTTTIQNGVDTDVYFPVLASEKAQLKEELGFGKAARVWISSGHLSDRKNPLTLIKAWKDLFQSSNEHLVFIGDGDLRTQCEEESKGFDNIHICGRVKSVVKYLQAADLFIASSKAEGLPNSVLEALACGLPILLSDIPPHKEMLSLGELAGLLYEAGNYENLLMKIREFQSLDLKVASEESLKIALEKLSANSMSRKYQNYYKELLNH